jgi:hypothetical protein
LNIEIQGVSFQLRQRKNSNSVTQKKLLKETIVVDFANNRESTKIPRGKLQVFSMLQLPLGSRQTMFGILMKDSQYSSFVPLLLVEFQMLPETPGSFQ